MPEDLWQPLEEQPSEPPRPSLRMRVGLAVVGVAALGTLGVVGAAVASAGESGTSGDSGTTNSVTTQFGNASTSGQATHDGNCPFGSGSDETSADGGADSLG